MMLPEDSPIRDLVNVRRLELAPEPEADLPRFGEVSDDVPPPLQPLSPPQWLGRSAPERLWVVPRWIPAGYVTLLYGDGGLGKSLVAQQLQTALAIGKPWLGAPVEPMPSLGLYCEDEPDELWRRQEAIVALYECDMADLAAQHMLARRGEDNLLMVFPRDSTRGELTPLWHQLRQLALDTAGRLAIIDTAADTFGGREIDRGQVRQFVQGCLGRLAREIGGSVMLLAHPSRAGMSSGTGDSGSTGWSNTARSRLYLTHPGADDDAEPDEDARILRRMKANYAARNEEIRLRWRDGAFHVDGTSTIAGGMVAEIEARRAERVFLALLDKFRADGRPVSDASNSARYAPKAFARSPDREGFDKIAFARAMERLFAAKIITTGKVGTNSQRHPIFGLVRVDQGEEKPDA